MERTKEEILSIVLAKAESGAEVAVFLSSLSKAEFLGLVEEYNRRMVKSNCFRVKPPPPVYRKGGLISEGPIYSRLDDSYLVAIQQSLKYRRLLSAINRESAKRGLDGTSYNDLLKMAQRK